MTQAMPFDSGKRSRAARCLRSLRRSWGTLAIGLLLAVATGVLIRARFFAPIPVQVHRVDRGEITTEVFGRGTVESAREVDLGFDLVGRLNEVLVDQGGRITLGQVLARLAPEQVSADFRVASTGINAARASLERIAADERHARAALDAAEREEQRSRTLLERGSAPRQELDRAQDQVRLARAELDRVLAQRGEATRSVELASGGADQRRVTVLRATLLAPFDGLVIRRLREPGDIVAVGSTVLRVVDTERVYVRAWIDETQLSRVHEGQAAGIRLSGTERSVAAQVSRVGWEADRQTHELLVDVTPTEPLGRIAIGQRADVWIQTDRKLGVPRLPLNYLLRDAQGPYCAVDEGGKIGIRRLELGAMGRDQLEVRSGLVGGETVLAALEPGSAPSVGRRWRAR